MPSEAVSPIEAENTHRLVYASVPPAFPHHFVQQELSPAQQLVFASASPLSLGWDEDQDNLAMSHVSSVSGPYEISESIPFDLYPAVAANVPTSEYIWKTIGGQIISSALTNAGEFQRIPSNRSRGIAFSNVDEIRGQTGPRIFGHLVGYLRAFFKPVYGRELANRVDELAHLVREDYKGAVEISAMSLYYLIAFLETRPEIRRPSLAATPKGYLIAQWRGPDNQKLSIHFDDSGVARAFLVATNENHLEQFDRSDVSSTADAIFDRAGLANLGWIRA